MEKRRNLMTINAQSLKNNCPSVRAIDAEVKRFMSEIEDQIRDAHRSSQYYIIYDMPVNFVIPNKRNAEAQREIYSQVIDQLEINYFDVKIHINIERCRLRISWLSENDRSEIDRQKNLLARVKSKDDFN